MTAMEDKLMKVTVVEKPRYFYLALSEWRKGYGHEIKVGEYSFCAIPVKNVINISETTTGSHVIDIPMDFIVFTLTSTKEGTLELFKEFGNLLAGIIEKDENKFKENIKRAKKVSEEKLGKMPEITEDE